MRKAILEKHSHPKHSNSTPSENAESEASPSLEPSHLAELVWKYFEPEIREALLEAQKSLAHDNDERTEQLSAGK